MVALPRSIFWTQWQIRHEVRYQPQWHTLSYQLAIATVVLDFGLHASSAEPLISFNKNRVAPVVRPALRGYGLKSLTTFRVLP